MRKLTSLILFLVAGVALPASAAQTRQARQGRQVRRISHAQDATPALQPIPEAQPIAPQPAGPMPAVGSEPIPATASVVSLFPNVRYQDERNIAPCAIPQVVMVKDPCPAP